MGVRPHQRVAWIAALPNQTALVPTNLRAVQHGMVLCTAANMKIRLRPSVPSSPSRTIGGSEPVASISSSSSDSRSGSSIGGSNSRSGSSSSDRQSAAGSPAAEQAHSPWFSWLRWRRRRRRQQRLQLVLLDHGLYRFAILISSGH